MKDAERIREYHKVMAPKWAEQERERQERILAMGMLLDANWSNSRGVFVKVVKREAGGFPTHWEEYYDEQGNRLGVKEDG
jgi:hypothetical protein